MSDAVTAARCQLQGNDFAWILRDCDQPVETHSQRHFGRGFDPKALWRVDNDQPRELRQIMLSLVALDALQTFIDEPSGDDEAGIRAFAEQNEGDGWMLRETLRPNDNGLGHDGRAREHQPVASMLGQRFFDWQLEQTPAESWAECERHARALGGTFSMAERQHD